MKMGLDDELKIDYKIRRPPIKATPMTIAKTVAIIVGYLVDAILAVALGT